MRGYPRSRFSRCPIPGPDHRADPHFVGGAADFAAMTCLAELGATAARVVCYGREAAAGRAVHRPGGLPGHRGHSRPDAGPPDAPSVRCGELVGAVARHWRRDGGGRWPRWPAGGRCRIRGARRRLRRRQHRPQGRRPSQAARPRPSGRAQSSKGAGVGVPSIRAYRIPASPLVTSPRLPRSAGIRPAHPGCLGSPNRNCSSSGPLRVVHAERRGLHEGARPHIAGPGPVLTALSALHNQDERAFRHARTFRNVGEGRDLSDRGERSCGRRGGRAGSLRSTQG